MTPSSTNYREIGAVIDRLEQDQTLYQAESFVERMQAADFLELYRLDDADLADTPEPTATEWTNLVRRTQVLKQRWDAANEGFIAHLVERIRANDYDPVRQYFKKAAQQISEKPKADDTGYDEIDMLINSLMEVGLVPGEPEEREADMIYYQPTPARVILKIIEALQPTSADVFYDLGSGLGHVPILVNLLAEIKTKGVELEKSYSQYATECLKKLGLPNVAFINTDARYVDYTDGTIFYMYTPFQGEVLRQVLALLEAQATQRPIKICTYGPCTLQVSKQGWLKSMYQAGKPESRLAVFSSM